MQSEPLISNLGFQNQFQIFSLSLRVSKSHLSTIPRTPTLTTFQRTPITVAATNTTAPPPPIQPSSDLDDICYFAGYRPRVLLNSSVQRYHIPSAGHTSAGDSSLITAQYKVSLPLPVTYL